MNRGPIFDRSVQLGWLDETVRLRREAGSDARTALEMWMRDRIQSESGREKTVTLLARIWLEPPSSATEMIAWATEQLPAFADPRPLHIGAMLATYPFFGDACAATGRQLALAHVVHTTDLKGRLRKRWGDRGAIDVGAQSVVRTLRALAVLVGRPGRTDSTRGEHVPVPPSLTLWIAHALSLTRGTGEVDKVALESSPELFMLELASLQPDGYPFGDVFTEGGGRTVFRARTTPTNRSATQQSIPGLGRTM